MADPKIRYDIAATASGAAEVEKLATEFEKLDGAVDPQLAERARVAAQALRDLGQQQGAVDTFVALKRDSLAARENLALAQQAAHTTGSWRLTVSTKARRMAGCPLRARPRMAAKLTYGARATTATDASLMLGMLATSGLS